MCYRVGVLGSNRIDWCWYYCFICFFLWMELDKPKRNIVSREDVSLLGLLAKIKCSICSYQLKREDVKEKRLKIMQRWTLIIWDREQLSAGAKALSRSEMLGYRVHEHQMLLDKYMNTCNQQGGQLRTYQFSSVAQLCLALATTWIVAHQASLSITSTQSLLQLMSIELVMPSSHLILCHAFFSRLQSIPASGSFPIVSSLHQLAKVLELQLHRQSFQ